MTGAELAAWLAVAVSIGTLVGGVIAGGALLLKLGRVLERIDRTETTAGKMASLFPPAQSKLIELETRLDERDKASTKQALRQSFTNEGDDESKRRR